MQQRRLRLGDILDDYCPRERRITNHAVVAMIEDTVKQTRCTTCDAEHEYKEAKVPAARRRKTGALEAQLVEGSNRAAEVAEVESSEEPTVMVDDVAQVAETIEPEVESPGGLAAAPASDQPAEAEPIEETDADRDEWPVHRPLIRATLPRPEGQTPERKAPILRSVPPAASSIHAMGSATAAAAIASVTLGSPSRASQASRDLAASVVRATAAAGRRASATGTDPGRVAAPAVPDRGAAANARAAAAGSAAASSNPP